MKSSMTKPCTLYPVHQYGTVFNHFVIPTIIRTTQRHFSHELYPRFVRDLAAGRAGPDLDRAGTRGIFQVAGAAVQLSAAAPVEQHEQLCGTAAVRKEAHTPTVTACRLPPTSI
jgi:hypothetical protein